MANNELAKDYFTSIETIQITGGNLSESKRLEELLSQTIAASNRTTHAVRAFVYFLFIQLGSVVLGLLIIFFGQGNGTESSQIFGSLVIIGGLLASFYFGWKEFQLSEVLPRQTAGSTSGVSELSGESLRKHWTLSKDQRIAWEASGRKDLSTWDYKNVNFEDWISSDN